MEVVERAVGIRKVPDQLTQGLGNLLHNGWNGHDLIAARQLWLLKKINHLDFVPALEVLFADAAEVFHGGQGFGGFTRDIQAQHHDLSAWCG